jgi:hypothetical protein
VDAVDSVAGDARTNTTVSLLLYLGLGSMPSVVRLELKNFNTHLHCCLAFVAHVTSAERHSHKLADYSYHFHFRQNKESHERAAERLADQTTRAPWTVREMGGRDRSNSHLSAGNGQRDRARTMEGGNLAIRCGLFDNGVMVTLTLSGRLPCNLMLVGIA